MSSSASGSSPDAIIAALQPYTTCDISDALLKLKYRNGGFLAGPTMWSPQRQEGDTKIIGPAYTIKYALNEDPAPKMSGHYIDAVPKGSVLFISCPPDVPNAAYGGLMSTKAQASGAVGTVVDGRIRDVREHRALNFPVFAREIGTASPYENLKVVGTNVPVKLSTTYQDMEVHPGDYIIGDIDGVVVLSADLAEKVVPLMQAQTAADEKVREAIAAGMSFVEAGKKFRS